MRNWLIKFLGGYTGDQYFELIRILKKAKQDLAQARKNDTPRDPKTGRFKKKSKY